MKKIIILLLASTLIGCVTGKSPQVLAFERYTAENRPKAEQGTLGWSDYYKGLYQHALAANAPGYLLSSFSSMINHANELDRGIISSEQFMAFRRESQIYIAEANRVANERHRQIQAQESAAAAANFSNALQLMQAGQPRPYQPVQPASGMTYMLQNQSVNGMLRYCYYHGGIVNTISSVELCPLSITR